jgi:ABC-2 type transport system permease protein
MSLRSGPGAGGGLQLGTARRIAGTELRRRLRNVLGNRTKLLVYAVVALIGLGPLLVFGSLLLELAGESLASGEFDQGTLDRVPEFVAGGVALALLGLTGMASIRAFTTVADLDEPGYLLVSTSLPNVVVGVVGTELLSFALWLGPPTLVLTAAFAYGAGTPLPVLTGLLTVALLLAVAVPAGFVVGVCVRHLLTVYEPIARYRTPIVVALGGLYFGSIAFGWFDRVTAVLFRLLGDSPLGWPGHLLLTGVPSVPFSWPVAGASLAGVVVVLPVVLLVSVRVAGFHWFADPARTEESETTDTQSESRFSLAFVRGIRGPVQTVTVTTLRRAKRSPIRLLYVAYPILLAFLFAEELIQTGTLPVYGAVALSLYVVWGTGGLFSLNLLGDRGPAMETELLSTVSGRTVVVGTTLAGLVVGVPLALVVPPAAGLVSPLSLPQVAGLTAGTLAGAVVSPLLAAGVGTLSPRFGSVRVVNRREAVMPSKTAFLLYTLAIALPVGAATVLWLGAEGTVATLLSALLSLVPVVGLTVGELAVTAVAWVLVVGGVVAPWVSALYAARSFDSYRPY